MSVSDYLAKLKRSLGLAFGAYVLHDFSMKMFLILYSITETKYVIKFLFRLLLTS